jgi:vacuolar-type H+-ATPase subunit I/STV1
MSKRPRTSNSFNTSTQRPVVQSITSPRTITVIRPAEQQQPSSSSTSTRFVRANVSNSNNDPSMAQKMQELEELVKKVVDENAALKAEVEDLKAEVAELKDMQNQNYEKTNELETILKSRRSKIQTNATFNSTPEMSDTEIQVRFSSEIAKFLLKDLINFDMENKPLDEVAKLIAIKMFEQLIPEGCTLANFSTASTPRYGYITIPSNLFDELAEKLVLLTQGYVDHNLKHALLLRINFGLNDKIKRARKLMRRSEHTPE